MSIQKDNDREGGVGILTLAQINKIIAKTGSIKMGSIDIQTLLTTSTNSKYNSKQIQNPPQSLFKAGMFFTITNAGNSGTIFAGITWFNGDEIEIVWNANKTAFEWNKKSPDISNKQDKDPSATDGEIATFLTNQTKGSGKKFNDAGHTANDIISSQEIDSRINNAQAGLVQLGDWDASTNTPILPSTPTLLTYKMGEFYNVTAGGNRFGINWTVRDRIVVAKNAITGLLFWLQEDLGQQAAQIGFDNSTNGFTAIEVQSAIEELNTNSSKLKFMGLWNAFTNNVTSGPLTGQSLTNPPNAQLKLGNYFRVSNPGTQFGVYYPANSLIVVIYNSSNNLTFDIFAGILNYYDEDVVSGTTRLLANDNNPAISINRTNKKTTFGGSVNINSKDVTDIDKGTIITANSTILASKQSIIEGLNNKVNKSGDTMTGALSTAGLKPAERTVTANYTVTATDEVIFADATTGALVIILSAATTNSKLKVVKVDSSANTVTITRAGSDTINGATTKVLSNQYDGADLSPDGISKWFAANSGSTVVSSSTPIANTIAKWDNNKNMLANNFLAKTDIVTISNALLTINLTSARNIVFIGADNSEQYIEMSSTDSFPLGTEYSFINSSGGFLTLTLNNQISYVFPYGKVTIKLIDTVNKVWSNEVATENLFYTNTQDYQMTGNITGSTNVSVPSVGGLSIGMSVVGSGILNDTIIQSINAGANTFVLNQGATNGNGVLLKINTIQILQNAYQSIFSQPSINPITIVTPYKYYPWGFKLMLITSPGTVTGNITVSGLVFNPVSQTSVYMLVSSNNGQMILYGSYATNTQKYYTGIANPNTTAPTATPTIGDEYEQNITPFKVKWTYYNGTWNTPKDVEHINKASHGLTVNQLFNMTPTLDGKYALLNASNQSTSYFGGLAIPYDANNYIIYKRGFLPSLTLSMKVNGSVQLLSTVLGSNPDAIGLNSDVSNQGGASMTQQNSGFSVFFGYIDSTGLHIEPSLPQGTQGIGSTLDKKFAINKGATTIDSYGSRVFDVLYTLLSNTKIACKASTVFTDCNGSQFKLPLDLIIDVTTLGLSVSSNFLFIIDTTTGSPIAVPVLSSNYKEVNGLLSLTTGQYGIITNPLSGFKDSSSNSANFVVVGEFTTIGSGSSATVSSFISHNTYYEVLINTVANGTLYLINHNFRTQRIKIESYIKNKIAEYGYSVGDELQYSGDGNSGTGGQWYGLLPTSNVGGNTATLTIGANGVGSVNKSNGNVALPFTTANWSPGCRINRSFN